MRWFGPALAAAVIASGCFSGSPGDAQAHVLVPAEGTGAMTGRVLDDESMPIVNASINLVGGKRQANTSADGTFTIPDLAPLVYLMDIRAEGHVGRQAAIPVAPDEVTFVEVFLERLPEPQPRTAVLLQANGMFGTAYTFNVSGIRGSADGILGGTLVPSQVRTDNYWLLYIRDPGWQTLLFEVEWQANNAAAEHLRMQIGIPERFNNESTSYTYRFTHEVGPEESPMRWRLDRSWYEESLMASHPLMFKELERPLRFEVLPTPPPRDGVGLLLQQKFDVWVTIAYLMELDEDFTQLAED